MESASWSPTAPLAALRLRALLLSRIRAFFEARGVLEVETPLLGHATVTDPHIESLRAGELFLQTSPEYAMKRLLASGSGPIYQICNAFRAGEAGRRHNPEFTLIEWYRPGFDHHALMDEVDAFLQAVLGTVDAERATYASLFERHLGVDPHRADARELEHAAKQHGITVQAASELSRDDWLNLLMAREVEPRLGLTRPLFVFDFPVELAALAQIRPGNPPVAERFEVYYRGVELANGFHELTDAREQRERFERDRKKRRASGLEDIEPDERLLQALESGIPPCSGVALGLDRLMMIAAAAPSIEGVLTFPTDRA